MARKLFTFSDVAVVGAGGTGSITFQVANGVDFVWCKGLYGSNIASVQAGTDVLFGGALITIEYTTGGNVQFQSKPAPINHWFGTMGLGNGPLLMATPMRFVNNSTIIIGFSDAPGGAGGSFRASMIGYTVPSGEA
jgi:hypothetical protein